LAEQRKVARREAKPAIQLHSVPNKNGDVGND
jgi:hypothetical protein